MLSVNTMFKYVLPVSINTICQCCHALQSVISSSLHVNTTMLFLKNLFLVELLPSIVAGNIFDVNPDIQENKPRPMSRRHNEVR